MKLIHLAHSRHLPRFRAVLFALLAVLSVNLGLHAQSAVPPVLPPVTPLPEPLFSQLIVFGDSLSDTGNIAHRSSDKFGITYPGDDFNYNEGRFTNGPSTDPNEKDYDGVWHEQLARVFLGLPRAKNSLDGGADYAFGGATTKDGTKDATVISNPAPFVGGKLTLTIDNMGKQVNDYLGSRATDPAALYILWGGNNDLFNDPSAGNVSEAAARVPALVERLARAGGVSFLVVDAPLLGNVPSYRDQPQKAAELNQAAADFRTQLYANLDDVQARLAAENIPFHLYRLDVFDLFTRMLTNPAAYGFTNITESAQGESVAAERYLFWDDVHPTTGGHFQIAAEAYSVLTGIPVVQLAPAKTDVNRNIGETGLFYITRTGPDLSTTLTVPYLVSGNAVAGTDYSPLKGFKMLLPDHRTAKVKVFTSAPPAGTPNRGVKLILQPGEGYQLPVVLGQKINLRTDR